MLIPSSLAGGWGGGGGWRLTWKKIGQGCAAGTLNTPPIHIISRMTKHAYSYNLHVCGQVSCLPKLEINGLFM